MCHAHSDEWKSTAHVDHCRTSAACLDHDERHNRRLEFGSPENVRNRVTKQIQFGQLLSIRLHHDYRAHAAPQ